MDKTGNLLPGFPLPTGERLIYPQIALADLDQDSRMEILAGTRTLTSEGQCRVFAWRYNGDLLSGWPISVAWNTSIPTTIVGSLRSFLLISMAIMPGDSGEHDEQRLGESLGRYYPTEFVCLAGERLGSQWKLAQWAHDGWLLWPLAAGDLNGDGLPDVIAPVIITTSTLTRALASLWPAGRFRLT